MFKQYSKNKPFAYDGYYEKPIPTYMVGPRLARFMEDCELFGVSIPCGYEVDGATVPRIFWWVISPFTEGLPAACVHDFRHTDTTTWEERKQWDREYYYNLRRCQVSAPRSFLAWMGVRTWAYLRRCVNDFRRAV